MGQLKLKRGKISTRMTTSIISEAQKSLNVHLDKVNYTADIQFS